ncbi:hypothetical protein Vafri_14576 [Volvox africanus]|uniref:Endonuclease/exonuclease/phosphatase domain-containing protein n=2 Tax=Volvox africanus TaxID=51714 RepID=A0A8J4F4W9_9CHLO|nr:hypothetical protein Vafri_14576 [Volvox africanus]
MMNASDVRPEGRTYITCRNSLKVISYNILAPKYASYNSYCPPKFLDWEYRRAGVLRELAHLGGDVVGLQECDLDFFNEELKDWMALRGIRGQFLERPVGPVPGPSEGIALLWQDAVFEVVEVRQELYSRMDPRVAGLPSEVAGTRAWSKLQEMGEGLLMALLRHRPSGRLILAAVTHLFWNPAFPDVKVLQAALMCGYLSAFTREAAGTDGVLHGPPPGLLLFGDFNSLACKYLPDKFDPVVPPGGLMSGVYTLLAQGSLPPEHPDHPATRVWEDEGPCSPGEERFPQLHLTSAQLQFTSLNAEAFGREPPLTTRTASWAGCIDFVWLSRGDFSVASALAMPYDDGGLPPLGPDADSTGGCGRGSRAPTWCDPLSDVRFSPIPDEFFPSDHLAVGGDVVVLPPPPPLSSSNIMATVPQ